MIHRGVWCVTALVSLYGGVARAEVRTAVARAQGAGPAFKLDGVAAPSKSDAATGAKVTLVDGARDNNGGDVSVLIDGTVPANEDQPRANFFFAAGTDGGRIAIDLGKPIKIGQVNTYSWHSDTRGPQVYKLYASEGTAADFNAAPKKGTDPESVGWKSVASVDTRAKENPAGGQHGASVSDSAGALGTYRYLLLDISPTEKEDGFGNTFFSEIDVVAAEGAAEPVAATEFRDRGGRGNRGGGNRMVWETPGPGDPNGPPPTVARTEAGDEITFDYSEAPELKDWVETKLKPVCVQWYPMIVAMLPSDDYAAPKKFSIAFRKEYRGVAAAAGTRINCSIDWFSKNLDGEAVGAVVHEMVHVVQQYRRGPTRNPGWLVEGVADYIRWFLYEPESARPKPRPDRANYNDSYRTTGHFLNYLTAKYDKDIVKKLNAAMRHGKWSDDLWKELTGKTADELGAEWKATLN